MKSEQSLVKSFLARHPGAISGPASLFLSGADDTDDGLNLAMAKTGYVILYRRGMQPYRRDFREEMLATGHYEAHEDEELDVTYKLLSEIFTARRD
jgi:hypothetical protein